MIACSALDDFIAAALTGDERERFAVHLTSCAECRAAVTDHERLAALLSAAVDSVPVPAMLEGRVRTRIHSARRRRFAAAAAVVAVAVAATIWLHGRPRGPIETQVLPPVMVADRLAEPARIMFPAGEVIAIREPMSSPNVTFVWVYPRLRAEVPPAVERNEQ